MPVPNSIPECRNTEHAHLPTGHARMDLCTPPSLPEQAARFVEVHTWAPLEHATFLASHNSTTGVPFCWECADWHFPTEPHSQP